MKKHKCILTPCEKYLWKSFKFWSVKFVAEWLHFLTNKKEVTYQSFLWHVSWFLCRPLPHFSCFLCQTLNCPLENGFGFFSELDLCGSSGIVAAPLLCWNMHETLLVYRPAHVLKVLISPVLSNKIIMGSKDRRFPLAVAR